MTQLDHLILPVNDREVSVEFFVDVFRRGVFPRKRKVALRQRRDVVGTGIVDRDLERAHRRRSRAGGTVVGR